MPAVPLISKRVANVMSSDAISLLVWLAKTLDISEETFFETLRAEWRRISARDVITFRVITLNMECVAEIDPDFARALAGDRRNPEAQS